MATWRERGYVPDSDDEEDIPDSVVHSQQPVRGEAVIDHPSHKAGPSYHKADFNLNLQCDADEREQQVESTASRLQKALDHGLQAVRDVLATTPVVARPEVVDDEDSPLSSLPSSIANSPPRRPIPITVSQVPEIIPHPFRSFSPSRDFDEPATRRTLRARAPIQQHPYMLEDAKYRQLMKDRGLKPIHLPPGAREVDSHRSGEESQQTEFRSSQVEESQELDLPSSPIVLHQHHDSPDTGAELPDGLSNNEQDEDFPELTQLINDRRPIPKRIYKSSRKSLHTLDNRFVPNLATSDIFDIPNDEEAVHSTVSHRERSFRVPSSPPGSSNLLPPLDDEYEGNPLMSDSMSALAINTPSAMTTPFLSSENGSRKRPRVILSSSEASQASEDDQSAGSSSRFDGDQNGQEDSQGLLEIRKKLQGVLPGSYLKVNRTTQESQRKARQNQSPIKGLNERGVARRMTTGTFRTGGRLEDIIDLSDSESERREPSQSSPFGSGFESPVTVPVATSYDNINELRLGEATEEADVDPMLPPMSTKKKTSNLKVMRQRKINQGWTSTSRRTFDQTPNTVSMGRHGQTNKANRQSSGSKKHKKIKRRHHRPEIGVLDAPGIRDTERIAQPRFLKVAARQAKRNANRSYPNQVDKIFRLATEKDTKEMNDQLEAMKRSRRGARHSATNIGGVKSTARSTNAAGSTRALESLQTSSDTQSARPNSVSELENLKQSTKSLLSRISRDFEKVAISNTLTPEGRIQKDSTATDENSNSRYLQSLFPHRNRSGRGQLLSRQQVPRTAQLEGERVRSLPEVSDSIRRLHPIIGTSRTTKHITSMDQQNSTPLEGAVQQAKTRRPRKQAPRKSSIRTADMNFETTGGFENVDVPADIKSNVKTGYLAQGRGAILLSVVDSVKILPRFTKFEENAIGSDIFRTAVEKFHDLLFDPTTPTSTIHDISTPLSQQRLQAEVLDSYTEMFVFKALDEMSAIIAKSTLVIDINENDYRRCLESASLLTKYVVKSAYFEGSREKIARSSITNFISKSTQRLEALVNRTSEADFGRSRASRQTTIRFLNWMVVYILNLYILARSIDYEQQKVLELLKSMIACTFQFVFEPQALLGCLTRLQDFCTLNESASLAVLDENFPEVESVVMAWHLDRILHSHFSPDGFYRWITTNTNSTIAAQMFEEVCHNVMAICFILPLTQIAPSGYLVRDPSDVEDTDNGCFNLIGSCLQNLVTQTPIARAPFFTGHLMEAMEDLCLKMILSWDWKPPPSLSLSFLRAYVWNSMLPFHTAPDQFSVFNDTDGFSKNSEVQNDNDFLKFIDILGYCISSLCKPRGNPIDGYTVPSASKIRGYIFSLIPNNAQSYDTREDLSAANLLALKNHFALYVSLYRRAPDGCRPRIEQLERQVDLTLSHYTVCKLAVCAWSAIFSCSYISSNEDLGGVSRWMNTMFRQAMSRLIEHDQRDAFTLLEDLLHALLGAIGQCDSEVTARALLEGSTLDMISQILTRVEIHQGDDEVLVAALEVLHAYVKTTLTSPVTETLIGSIQMVLKGLIQQTLGKDKIESDQFLRHLMTAWFSTAQVMVRTFHKYWNDFVDPHSSLSIDFLSGLRDSYAANEAKECFYSDLIEADESYFFLECRPIVFMTWVATLLLPVHSLRFEHILTNRILKHERQSLMIKDLARTLLRHDNKHQLTIQDISNSRIMILRHIIQNIYGQQGAPEEEWLTGGLDPASLTKLLRTMTTTMKNVWLDLKGDPVAQNDYTALVHAILNEMETYPYPDFKIDPWFSHSSEFPRPEQTLDNIFKCRFGEQDHKIAKSSIVTVRLLITRAIESGKKATLLSDLTRVFHCLDPLRVRESPSGSKEYSINFSKQAKFIQLVFYAYFDSDDEGIGYVNPHHLSVVLELLKYITAKIPFRIDNLEPSHMIQFVTATASILNAVRKLVESTHLLHPLSGSLFKYSSVAARTSFAILETVPSSCLEELPDQTCDAITENILRIYEVMQTHIEIPSATNPDPRSTWREDQDITDQSSPSSFSSSASVNTRIDRTNVTVGAWTDDIPLPKEMHLDLVPEGMSWCLHADPVEPELSTEEREVREFARRELRNGAFVPAVRGLTDEEMTSLQREMWGFAAVVKELRLLEEAEEEEE